MARTSDPKFSGGAARAGDAIGGRRDGRRAWGPRDAGTPGHVLGAPVRGETTRCGSPIGPRRHRLRGI